jgi:hypothetical protein
VEYVLSIWNRIGDVATSVVKGVGTGLETTGKLVENVGKFGVDLAYGVGGVAKMAYDIGTAPWNDDEDYNGFVKPFKSAWNDSQKNVVRPLASAGGAIMKVPGLATTFEKINEINQEYIREPAATFNLVQTGTIGGTASFFDPNDWKKAYRAVNESQEIIDPITGEKKTVGPITIGQAISQNVRLIFDPKFNIYDPRERDMAFNQSAWGKTQSGLLDVTALFVGDVTLGAAKGVKVAAASTALKGTLKTADDVAKAAEDITKAQYGVNNRFTKVLDDFTANDSVYALNHPLVRSSNQPALLAHLLGQSDQVDQTALILRSAMGDPKALDDLAALRADMSDALKVARGDISAVDEYKLFAAPDEAGMIPFLNDSPSVMDDAQANYNALLRTDETFAKMMALGSGVDGGMSGGTLRRTTGYLGQGVEDFVAKSRSIRFYDQNVGTANIEVFQPTPFHRLYQKISWGLGERPAGIVDFNDADSFREVVATLERLRPSDAIAGVTPVNLRRLGALTDDEANGLLDNYMKALTPEDRQLAAIAIESTAVRALAIKHGVDIETADLLYKDFSQGRRSALASIKDRGFMVDTDGSILKVPQLESQTGNFLPIMDFEVLDRLLRENANFLLKAKGKFANPVFNTADAFQDLFKAAVLIRLGYTIRNGIDSQARIMAAVGAMTTLRHLGPGLKNFIYNTVKEPTRLIDRYLPKFDGMTIKNVQQSANMVTRELNEIKTRMAELEARVSLKPDDLDAMGELNTLRLLREEKLAVYNHYNDIINRVGTVEPKKRIGTGSFEVVASDGSRYELYDAFGGPLGEMFRRTASSANSFQRMVDSNSDMFGRALQSRGYGVVKPTDPGYFEQWAQTLRQQFGNSEVVRRLVAGESVDDISRWLAGSPEGRILRKRLAINTEESAEYVTKISRFLDNYLPESSGLRTSIREVTANDLRSAFKDPTTLPVIHGHILEEAVSNGSNKAVKRFINGAFKFLAQLPEDAWARNPLYIQFYRQEARRRIDIVSGLKGGKLTVADQEAIMSASHKVAVREMKGVLFNIERRSNLAGAMKFISPFFSAQENAYKTWLKLSVANPAIANRGYMVWQAPNRAGLVTDQDGNPVPEGQTSGSDVIWLSIPKGMKNIPFIGAGLGSFVKPDGKSGDKATYTGGLGIPKQSLDIIFQGGMDVLYNKGNPNIASDIFPVGPYIAAPISEIVKDKPELEEAFKWALPYGASKDLYSNFLPAWVQKSIAANKELDDAQFAKSYSLIFSTEMVNAKRNGTKIPTAKEIMIKTQDYWKLRIAANLILPFAPRFDSPYQYYIQKSREYKQLYGMDADAKFLKDFPEYFAFTASTSNNPAKVDYTVGAVKNIKKYGDLLSELANIEPKLIGFVVNEKEGYKFSDAAYKWLYNNKISADAPQKFLEPISPAESRKKNEAELGWIKYGEIMDTVDAQLAARGLSSITQKGAEDLKAYKEIKLLEFARQKDAKGEFILDSTTGQFAQTPWYDDYKDSDGSKTNRVIYGLSKILNNPNYRRDNKDSATFKSLEVYFDIRKKYAKELLSRTAKSIDAKSNVDVRIAYDSIVNKLKTDDPIGFGPFYDRFLSQDLIIDKYLTPEEPK